MTIRKILVLLSRAAEIVALDIERECDTIRLGTYEVGDIPEKFLDSEIKEIRGTIYPDFIALLLKEEPDDF